jgi:hypothetical protein
MAVTIKTEQIRNTAVTPAKIDLTQTFSFASGILRAATPAGDSDVATKQYVDGLLAGLHWKESVRVATTANITLSGTQTIDGVSLSADDRVLVKNQSSADENGIYVVAAGSWSRSSDMDNGDEFPGAAVFVREGTDNADLGYVCTNDSVTLGTTEITFTQFNGAANITAGDGLSKTGNILSVNVDDSSIEIVGDALQVKDGGIDNDMLAGSIANNKLANSTISGVALGGTLNALSAASTGGITITSYDGSAAVSDLAINLDGSTLATGASGLKINTAGVDTLQIADSAVTAVKLAGSIPADKLNLGTALTESAGNLVLDASVAGNGLALSSQVLSIDLDGATLALSASGLKVSDAGINTAQIADDAVTAAKVADGAINASSMLADGVVANSKLAGSIPADKLNTGDGLEDNAGVLQVKLDGGSLAVGADGLAIATDGVSTDAIADAQVTGAKLAFAPLYTSLSGQNGSKTAFDLPSAIDGDLADGTIVYLNGLAIEKVASTPGTDQYTVSATGGTGGVGLVTFGTAPGSSDTITVLFFG